MARSCQEEITMVQRERRSRKAGIAQCDMVSIGTGRPGNADRVAQDKYQCLKEAGAFAGAWDWEGHG